MASKVVFISLFVFSLVAGQNNFYKVCISNSQQNLCQSLDKDDSKVVCEPVESRVDCAIKLARRTADIGVFSEEELLLLGQQQPNDHKVIGSIRNIDREDPYAFEAVALVPSSHVNGFEGLRNGNYCHPGLDESELRWSPRVLKSLERLAARTDKCTDSTDGKTAEEMEIATLSSFFSAGCRPGPWSANSSIDASLKSNYPSLCSLCGGAAPTCDGYGYDMGVAVAGVSNSNPHVKAIECLVKYQGSVAFVAWQHVREYFSAKAYERTTSFALLCQDGTLKTLTTEALANQTSPCSLVKQPWKGIVATTARAAEALNDLRTWWPSGQSPGTNSWHSTLFDVLVGGPGLKVVFQDQLPSPLNYTSVRALTDIDSIASCMPARRWCAISEKENIKCNWIRRASYILGIEPIISCQQRANVFQCLEDLRDSRSDFISVDSDYGYIARQHYKLSPVKLLQNSRSNPLSLSRVAALVKETSAQSDVTRFENLRGKRACFPEFGGTAYVSFVRTAHERGIISASECDYTKAVGEFFSATCAPGAEDASHAIGESSYNATNLCTACKPAPLNVAGATRNSDYSCAWDYSNLYFGSNGTLSCLSDSSNDVAFLEIQNVNVHLTALNLQPSQFRVLCRNNTLAATTGVNVDDNCLLSLLVDAEVLARRNDPQYNSLNSLLDHLDLTFGYNAAVANQLINLEIFSTFDSTSDLLFKDSAIGLSEASSTASNEPARNYFELFSHLESCTGSASALASEKNVFSMITLAIAVFMSKYVI